MIGHRQASHASRLALGLLALGACGSGAGPSDPAAGGHPRTPPPDTGAVTLAVLFIGNSLTYTNNLPGTLAAIALAAGDTIRVDMVAGPKLTLMDHLIFGDAQAAILRGGWDIVVLQQSASTDSAGRAALILATERLDTIVRSVGARPALYMVWPPANQPDSFCAARVSYQMAAAAVNGIFLPAGSAWQYALRQDPALALYDPDGNHPSPLGTYLAAITIYEQLTDHDAHRLDGHAVVVNGAVLNLPALTVRLLQDAAHATVSAAASDGGCNAGQAIRELR